MEWAQQHLDPATYESEFGEVSEADDTTVMSFSLPAETAERIRRSAREQGLSISAYILKNLHI